MYKLNQSPIYLAIILALSGCGGGGGGGGRDAATPNNGTTGQTSTVSGKVVDGYLNGATVFCDASKNGVFDTGEVLAVTSGQGDFTLASACSATLVSTGGTDVSTGYAFRGMLKSPAGAAIVSPLTTLIADTGLSNAQLVKMLGLPDGSNVAMIDPAAAGNAKVLKATLAVQQIVQQMANLMGKANESGALARIYSIIATSFANTLAASSGEPLFAANGTVNVALLAAAIQNAANSIASESSLKATSLTSADIDGIALQLSQQAEAFTKATDADLNNVARQLQDPQLPPPETAAVKTFYIAPKNDSVI